MSIDNGEMFRLYYFILFASINKRPLCPLIFFYIFPSLLASIRLYAHTMATHSIPPKRVAIIGSGVTGLGALYALRNTPHEVHLYESADRLGGHTNTVAYKHNNRSVNVDTGFIVMNSATYRM